MTEHAVVIAGGGPTGLMLAGELALAGGDGGTDAWWFDGTTWSASDTTTKPLVTGPDGTSLAVPPPRTQDRAEERG